DLITDAPPTGIYTLSLHDALPISRGSDVLEHDEVVLPAGRGLRLHHVRDLLVDLEQLLFGGVLLGLRLLDVRRQLPGLRQQGFPLFSLGLADLLAESLLFSAQVVGTGDRRPATLVRGKQGVHQGRVLAAGTLRSTYGFRIFA